MNTHNWDAIEPILDKALELHEDERSDFIKYACKSNSKLEEEVRSLLKAIQSSEDEHFLENSFEGNNEIIQSIAEERIADDFIGKRIGAFELTEQIGSGGMSTVFKGERADGQFDQKVAVKLIRGGLHSKHILQRFELEKQILAGLSHVNIASLYDGGITVDGNPYLIMEYITGKPIDIYCDEQKLTINQRLRLFQHVCSAVQYAHNNLIVHRDLKAQNIYVTEEGLVKILDFGIAKLLDTKLSTQELLTTLPGQNFWTPQYASPEQIREEPVTTASDIYSLGVLFHKLLTAAYPFNFDGKSITQIRATVVNNSPDSLLKSIQKSTAPEKAAEQRNTTVLDLKKTLRGDLEAIAAKTLRKDPSDRYSSAGRLAEDIKNYQGNLPVSAHKGNLSYRSKKFAKRYKKGIGLTALSFLIIICLTIFYTHQLSQQKQQAVYAANKAAKVSNLLKNILRQSSPYYTEEITLKEILAKGERQIKSKLQDQPLLKAEMMGLLGEIYTNLGLYSNAKPLLTRGLQGQKKGKRANPELYALNLQRLGYLLFRQGYFEESEKKYKEAEKVLINSNNGNKKQLSSLYNSMGMLFGETARRKQAIKFYRRSLSLLPDKNKSARATTMGNLGIVYQELGEFNKALSLLNKELKLRKEISNSPTPNLANSYNNLAFTFQRKGNLQKADSLHRIALNMRENILPPNHPHIASSLVRFGLLKVYQGKLLEAEHMFERAFKILRKALPDDHWQVLSAKGSLALSRGLQGELSTAIPILDKVHKRYKKQFGASDWRTKEAYKALQALLYHKQQIEKNNLNIF